jgi:hypothetical protein
VAHGASLQHGWTLTATRLGSSEGCVTDEEDHRLVGQKISEFPPRRKNMCHRGDPKDGVGDSPQLSEKETRYSENLCLLAQARHLRWSGRCSGDFANWGGQIFSDFFPKCILR